MDPSCFAVRLLPLATLGQGKTALPDKVAAHIHQTWCEYGPNEDDVRTAFSDVRQVLTDMGVEFGMANYHDVISDCLRPAGQRCATHAASASGASGFLFPFALQVPGLLHILDWVIRETVQQFPFWPKWQTAAKRILQFTHGHNHRELLKQHIRDQAQDSDTAADLAA